MRFIRTQRFLKDLKRIGATASEVAALEQSIASDPMAGVVIPGLRGVRKIRFALAGRGKRGGGRAVYFLVISNEVAVMIFAYAKNEQSDLTPAQRKEALSVLAEFEDD